MEEHQNPGWMSTETKHHCSLHGDLYRRLPKDPTKAMIVEWKSTLLCKKSSVPKVIQQLQPQDSRPTRLYWFQKIHKEGASLTSIISNIST
ncbi:hypothetical protein L798_08929 [Zootermopsis nevadensis]|uniref:Uncharacterized protein n=1 Tax=Zootermopsis nevadensis TaxID=136037 RepID=A0A067R1G4_ZOONE|nr:hypothetical protein L798_08929 [Zootermopsis nevadensis]